MKTTSFIDKVESLGYECKINGNRINIIKLSGSNLRIKYKIATIMINASYQYNIALDPSDVAIGLGDLIMEYGSSSIRQRGQLYKYNINDGNLY